MPHTAAGHFHAVKFYDTPAALCRIVAEFLSEGVASDQPLVIVATPDHHARIVEELARHHLSVDDLEAAGDLVLADASGMLETFMVNGKPDANLFAASMTILIERARRGRANLTIRIYGEMVDVLWKSGQDEAAIRAEMLWNTLAQTQDFSLLCGYAIGSFYKDTDRAAIERQHSHVILNHGRAAQVLPDLLS